MLECGRSPRPSRSESMPRGQREGDTVYKRRDRWPPRTGPQVIRLSRSDAGATPEKCQLDVGTDIILIFQNASDIKLGEVVTLALRGFC